MIRAERVLGRRPSWKHFDAHLRHALRCGYDYKHGGLYNRGVGDEPASQRDKVWWVQSEMMAALTDAIRNHVRPDYGQALEKLNEFIWTHQVDPRDGIWYETVAADGTIVNGSKATNWKANYHDVRAMVKFYETFEFSENLQLNWPLEARPGAVAP